MSNDTYNYLHSAMLAAITQLGVWQYVVNALPRSAFSLLTY